MKSPSNDHRPTDEQRALAVNLWRTMVWDSVLGHVVEFKRDVQRGVLGGDGGYAITIPKGTRGRVVPWVLTDDGRFVACVELDDRMQGLEDHDNEVHWILEDGLGGDHDDDEDIAEEFKKDIAILGPPALEEDNA